MSRKRHTPAPLRDHHRAMIPTLAFLLTIGTTAPLTAGPGAPISAGTETPIKLEVTAFEPKTWNGKVIVVSHGSTGNDPSKVKFTWTFPALSRALADKGFRVLVLMRKGRGASEGDFTEENTRSCAYSDRMREVAEAEPQLDQFVDWVRAQYAVGKVYLVGHSRGGYLSSYYGTRHQDKIAYAVNISGGWATLCEAKNRQTILTLTETAGAWKNQLWVYAINDKYFSNSQIDDYKALAEKEGIPFIKLQTTEGDGHRFAYANPHLWLDKFSDAIANAR